MALSSCAQPPKNMNTTLISDLYKEVKHRGKAVQYHAGIQVGGCAFEFFVNDLPVVQYFENGNGALNTSAPINDHILKSGTQTWKLVLYPAYLKGIQTEPLSKGIEANIEIETLKFREDGVDNIAPTFSLIETPKKKNEKGDTVYAEAGKKIMVYEGTFQAIVPYELKGWSQSVDLRKEDSPKLLQEVITAYQEYISILKDKDAQKVAEKVYKKERECAQAYFMDEEATKDRWNNYKTIFTIDGLELQSLEHYQMKIYGDGRIVCLERTDYPNINEPAIRARYKDEKGRGQVEYYYYYLHRPQPSSKLEIIR